MEKSSPESVRSVDDDKEEVLCVETWPCVTHDIGAAEEG